jgi:hypothetical protein
VSKLKVFKQQAPDIVDATMKEKKSRHRRNTTKRGEEKRSKSQNPEPYYSLSIGLGSENRILSDEECCPSFNKVFFQKRF